MAYLLLISVFLICLIGPCPSSGGSVRTADVIKMRGFLSEVYQVETKGGVALSLHRIINPLADPTTLNKYPVLYGHGVLYDSQSMISRSENSRPRKPVLGKPTIDFDKSIDGTDDQSLPFMFSNNNFDVWLFDARGVNDQNRNLSTEFDIVKSNKYWDFSLDDQALIDLALLIDFVLVQTASEKLVYVGYSESTFFMFALLAAKPEYADKVAAYIALAPVAYVSNIRGMTLPLLASIGAITPEFVHYSILPKPVIETVDLSLRGLCVPGLSKLLCSPLINSIGGQGSGEMAPSFFLHFFKSTSIKAFKQFTQLFKTKRFAMYDYGPATNMRLYGTPISPEYKLSRIVSDRIILVRGLADFLSNPQDQGRLIRELGRKPYLDIVIPKYNHFDFIDGKNLIKLVNGPAMIAVFELMYKDGPSVIKTPAQAQATELNRQIHRRQALLISGASIGNRLGQQNLGLFGGIQSNLVQNLLG